MPFWISARRIRANSMSSPCRSRGFSRISGAISAWNEQLKQGTCKQQQQLIIGFLRACDSPRPTSEKRVLPRPTATHTNGSFNLDLPMMEPITLHLGSCTQTTMKPLGSTGFAGKPVSCSLVSSRGLRLTLCRLHRLGKVHDHATHRGETQYWGPSNILDGPEICNQGVTLLLEPRIQTAEVFPWTPAIFIIPDS